jgi:hypothetical protein
MSDVARTLLQASRRQFEPLVGLDIHTVLIVANNLSDDRLGLLADYEDRGVPPLPRYLHDKSTVHKSWTGFSPPSKILILGNRNSWGPYANVSASAIEATITAASTLDCSAIPAAIRDSIEASRHSPQLDEPPEWRAAIWSAIVHIVLTHIVPESSNLVRLWAWDDTIPLNLTPVPYREGDRSPDSLLTMWLAGRPVSEDVYYSTLVQDAAKSAIVAIDCLLGWLPEITEAQSEGRQSRLVAHTDADPPFISLNGKPCSVFDPCPTFYVAALIEANGWPVSFAEFVRRHSQFEGAVTNRELDKIPPVIADFIDRPGKGGSPSLKVEMLR